ncbi:hypothetical protein [Maritalea sp. S77]|uniref:hypothetical protein n=1 Tax=Maritalea sp. S77 TaxID=3415125 RepID=UPI003C7B81EE
MANIITPNSVFLDARGSLERQPLQPKLQRPKAFWQGFDQFGLFYDVFRDVCGKTVWFVGPQQQNLASSLEQAYIVGEQSGIKSKLSFVKSRTACVAYVELPEVDKFLTLQIADQSITTQIGSNLSNKFEDKKVVFCINNNNNLEWIANWAKFYHVEHGANAVVVYDNKSNSYSHQDISNILQNVAGIEQTAVVDWPFHFGVMDKVGQDHGESGYVRFAQPVMYMSLYLRLASLAHSMLNVDVDELVLSSKGRSIFEVTKKRFFGCSKFQRFLVENVLLPNVNEKDQINFNDFAFRNMHKLGAQDHMKKWAMAPRKVRPKNKIALPNTHWIEGVWNPYPVARDFKCYHFAGINTGWRAKTQKGERAEWQHKRHITEPYDPKKHVKDEFLAKKLNEIFGQ